MATGDGSEDYVEKLRTGGWLNELGTAINVLITYTERLFLTGYGKYLYSTDVLFHHKHRTAARGYDLARS